MALITEQHGEALVTPEGPKVFLEDAREDRWAFTEAARHVAESLGLKPAFEGIEPLQRGP